MAEILGLGITHYPPLCLPDAQMSGILRWTLDDPAIPPEQKDPSAWPEAMRAEWSDDFGTRAARLHREALVAGLDRVRSRLDEFRPDVVIIWGDDQYENFHEDVIPPFAICAYDDIELRPWAHASASSAMKGRENVWNEDATFGYRLRGRPDVARQLVASLIESDFDVAYAYKPLHHASVAPRLHELDPVPRLPPYRLRAPDHLFSTQLLWATGRLLPGVHDADEPASGLRPPVAFAKALHGPWRGDRAGTPGQSVPCCAACLLVLVSCLSRG